MVSYDSQYWGSQIHVSEEIIFPYSENEKSGLEAPTSLVSLSSPESQCRFATTLQVFILSLHFLCFTVKQRSAHQLTASTLKLAEGKHWSQGECRLQLFHWEIFMCHIRKLWSHKCSCNYELLSHFSVFTPESAWTLQRDRWLLMTGTQQGLLFASVPSQTQTSFYSEQVFLESWWRVWIHS